MNKFIGGEMKYFILLFLVSSSLAMGQFLIQKNLVGSGGKIVKEKNEVIAGIVGETSYGDTKNSTYRIRTGFVVTYGKIIKDYSIPKNFELYQNYPNPFNPTTTIEYELPEKIRVQLTIYDILGREVKELVNEVQDAGKYKIHFNANGLASGVYIYRLLTDKYAKAKKMILLK